MKKVFYFLFIVSFISFNVAQAQTGCSATCDGSDGITPAVTPMFMTTAPTAINIIACDPLPPPVLLQAMDCAGTVWDIAPSVVTISPTLVNYVWTATCGTLSVTETMIINLMPDVEAPIITGPSSITVDCSAGGLPDPAFTDNSDPSPTFTFTDNNSALNSCGLGIKVRTWTAKDCAGNVSATFVQNITITKLSIPAFDLNKDGVSDASDVMADVIIACNGILPTDTINATHILDDCATFVTLSVSTFPFASNGCGFVDRYQRTWFLSDCIHTPVLMFQYIDVIDTVNPVLSAYPTNDTIMCPSDTTSIPSAVITAFDQCDQQTHIVKYRQVYGVADACGNRVITRTWESKDCKNNDTIHTQLIVIMDTILPVFDGIIPDSIVACQLALPILLDLDAGVTVTDNCDIGVTFSSSQSSVFDACGLEQVILTWSSTDCSGNTTTETRTITQIDTVAPIFTELTPKDTIVSCPNNIPNAAFLQFTDNCDALPIQDIVNVATTGPCGISQVRRKWVILDCSGNIDSVIQIITVSDTIKPNLGGLLASDTLMCIFDTTAAVQLLSTDNCDAPSIIKSTTITTLDACGNGTVVRRWTATDCAGNDSTFLQTITILDTIKPIIQLVAGNATSASLTCGTPLPPLPSFIAFDNCDTNVNTTSITFTDVRTAFNCITRDSTITRIWALQDCSGNKADTIKQVFIINCPIPGATIGNDQNVCMPGSVTLAATGVGTWSAPSGSFSNINNPTAIYSPASTANGPVLLTWNVFDPLNLCPSQAFTMTVNVTNVEAGSLTGIAGCIDNTVIPNTTATISASIVAPPTIPPGFELFYVLTTGPSKVVELYGNTSTFNVNTAGVYYIHTLVIDIDDFATASAIGTILPGVTTAIQIYNALTVGGGAICGDFDITGGLVNVVFCPTFIEDPCICNSSTSPASLTETIRFYGFGPFTLIGTSGTGLAIGSSVATSGGSLTFSPESGVPYTLTIQDGVGNILNIANTCATAASCSGFTVTGTVFYDVDEDGIYQIPLDAFQPGFGITIYVDDNADGLHQPTETNAITTVYTNTSGIYLVENLTNGNYVAVITINPTTYSILNGEEPIIINNANYNVSAGLTTNFIVLSQDITTFNATDNCTTTTLNWVNENETNIEKYEIQMSYTGLQYDKIATVSKNENPINNGKYFYTLNTPNAATTYYRIAAYTKTGIKTYTKIIGIDNDCLQAITVESVYPNPFFDELNIQINSSSTQPIAIEIIDLTGRILFSKNIPLAIGIQTITLKDIGISSGMYMINFKNEMKGIIKNYKLIKIK